MVKRKFLAMLMVAAVLITTSIGSSMNVQATENDVNADPVTTFENSEQEEIEIPTVEVPEITYNAEGNEKCEQTFFFEGIQTLDMNDEEDNTDPNNAVEILNGEKKTNSLLTDEFRWYHFTIQQLSKLTIYLEMDDTIDADLYLFSLNADSGELSIIGNSLNEGTGVDEAIAGKIEAGTYFIVVSGYEGSDNFSLGLYTSTRDVDYEFNDSLSTATEVSGVFDLNGTCGVIDSPYDVDFYKLTLSEASAVRFELKYTSDKYAVYYYTGNAMYAIKDDLYALDEGTHYFVVLSTDGSYSATRGYTLYIHNIAPVSTDETARFYVVCDRANIVFQFNGDRTNFYVNGNEIDFSYSYKRSSSSVDYDISLRRTSNFNVCLLQTEGTSLPLEYQQVIPDAVHVLNSSFSGIKDKYVLTLSVFDWSTPCYWIHVRGTGSSSDMTYWKDLNMANLYIDPDTGKVIDIEWYNYFYENLNYRLTFTRPYTMKYYYPYWNGEEPKGGDD